MSEASSMGLVETIREQRAEIERLTAERDKFERAWLRVDAERLDLKLENHNLRAVYAAAKRNGYATDELIAALAAVDSDDD